MASRSLGTLTLDLIAKVGGFEEGMDKGGKAAAKWRASVEKDAKAVGTAIGAATAVATAALTALTIQTVNSAKEISKLSSVSGLDTTSFQKYAEAAKVVGVEQDKLADIFKDTNDKIGDFLQTGAGPMKDFFENIAPKVGVTAQSFAKLSGPQALGLYVSSLEKAKVNQAEMTFYMEAIANDASLLLPLLKDNAKGFTTLGEMAEKSGAVMDKSLIDTTNRLEAAMMIGGQAAKGLQNQFMTGLLPSVSNVAEAMLDVSVNSSIAEDAGRTLGQLLQWLGGVAAGVYASFDLVGRSIATLAATVAAADLDPSDLLVPGAAGLKFAQNFEEIKAAFNAGVDDLEETALQHGSFIDKLMNGPVPGAGASRVGELAALLEEIKARASAAGGAAAGTGEDLGKLATEAENAQKKLAQFVGQTLISVTANEALAAAYLKGEEAVAELARQQKIEEQVLKLGEKAREQIVKAINAESDARDRMDVAKNVADIRKQTLELQGQSAVLIAQSRSLDEGRAAQEAYNAAKIMAATLAGKNADAIAKERKALEEQIKVQQAESRRLQALTEIDGLIDSTATSQEKLNKALEHYRSLEAYAETPEQLEAIRRAMVQAKNETNIWAKATERAIDQVDQAGADFWETFLDGGKFSFDSLKDIAKKWAAEMLNMMTFKPLLTSFSNMLFKTNNSGGIGDVWGGLFGGGGGSSGGGGLGNIAGMFKNLYSLYDTITGVGTAAYTGFQSGGFSGALSSIGSHYADSMLGQAYNTVTGWFTGAAAQATAEAASSAAAQAAGQAVGNSLAVNAGQYAASTATSSTLSSTLSSLTGMLSNPYTWITAGVMASWKLWDQGVQVSGDSVTDRFENASKPAQAWASTRAIESYGFEAIDKFREIENWMLHPLPSAVIGGDKLAAISTGSPVFQAVSEMFGRLFGGGEKFKTTVGSAVGVFDGSEYTGKGASENWFNGTKTFGEDVDGALHDLNETFSKSLGGLFEMFDIDETIQTEARVRLRRTSGKLATDFFATIGEDMIKVGGQFAKGGNIQKGLAQFFDVVMGEGLSKAIGVSDLPDYLKELTAGLKKADEVSAAIGGLFQRFDGANAVIETMGFNAFELSDKGLRASDALVNMSAALTGLENPTSADKLASLGSLTEGYMNAFVPASDKYAATLKTLRATFEEMEQAIPGSRKGFMDLVKALDLTTEEGRSAFATYMALSESMGDYYSNMEQLQANYLASFGTGLEQQAQVYASLTAEFSKLGLAMPATRDGFRSLVDGIDTTTDAGQDLQRMLMGLTGSMDSYYSSLESAQSSISGNIGNLREQIYLDALGTDQNRYNYMKAQADNLSALLPNLFDIGAITDVTNRITQLTSQAYGLLDESGKNTNAQQMIEFLDKIQAQANEQLEKANDETAQKQAVILKDALKEANADMAAQLKRAIIEGASAQGAVIGSFDSIVQQLGTMLFQMVRGIGSEVTG